MWLRTALFPSPRHTSHHLGSTTNKLTVIWWELGHLLVGGKPQEDTVDTFTNPGGSGTWKSMISQCSSSITFFSYILPYVYHPICSNFSRLSWVYIGQFTFPLTFVALKHKRTIVIWDFIAQVWRTGDFWVYFDALISLNTREIFDSLSWE